ncbi:hypothetical protein G3I36_22600 [Streptomyces sp. SID10362]|uniref:hypothetical protein n=1 Tax=Streptomyces sp. SID10362 TaxID=2706021 RepID=UPI0013CB6532|nr:hypothetical protein [Streptomyces sp. SID10362]NDZ73778.1 hypothetical protein [Streptomyces sp. SID10362]QUW92749.1 hypothetical protein KE639_03990 [Streptomyces sp. V17-9]
MSVTVHTLVVYVRPDVRQQEIAPSCVVHDVLELAGDDDVLNRSRLVTFVQSGRGLPEGKGAVGASADAGRPRVTPRPSWRGEPQ